MNPYRYRVSLRATHPRDDLLPLFEQLGLMPRRAWQAGQPRASAVGEPVAVYRDSYAHADLTSDPRDWSHEPLEDFLQGVLQRLAAHRDTLHTFFVRGGRCGLFVGVSGEQAFGFELSPELSGGLAALKLTLGFDILPASDT